MVAAVLWMHKNAHAACKQFRSGGRDEQRSNRCCKVEVIYMLATLQSVLKFILTFSSVLGIAFMILCTAFVVVSLIRGDIKIGMVKDETEKEEK